MKEDAATAVISLQSNRPPVAVQAAADAIIGDNEVEDDDTEYDVSSLAAAGANDGCPMGKRFARRARRWAQLQQKRAARHAASVERLIGRPIINSMASGGAGPCKTPASGGTDCTTTTNNKTSTALVPPGGDCCVTPADLAAMGVGFISMDDQLPTIYSGGGFERSAEHHHHGGHHCSSEPFFHRVPTTAHHRHASLRAVQSVDLLKMCVGTPLQYGQAPYPGHNPHHPHHRPLGQHGGGDLLLSTGQFYPGAYSFIPGQHHHHNHNHYHGSYEQQQQQQQQQQQLPLASITASGRGSAAVLRCSSPQYSNKGSNSSNNSDSLSCSSNASEELSSLLGDVALEPSSSSPSSSCSVSSTDGYSMLDSSVRQHKALWRSVSVVNTPTGLLRTEEQPTFTVLCYNVLCDKYATSSLYSYCPSWALNWEYRKNAIMKEIRHYEADIITLQEVETEQYNALFRPELEQLGYAGIFSPKSRAKTMSEEERKYVDGCAILWKYDKFEIEKEHLIEFTQVAIKKAQASEPMLNRVMPRDNIALCAVLKLKEGIYNNQTLMQISPSENVVGNPLVVCTAHIHWDPEFCDVKLIQTMMLVQEANRLLTQVGQKHRMVAHQIPFLICGDLNSLPDSGVYEYLAKGAIARDHVDLKGFKNDPCLQRLSDNSDDKENFSHLLRLESACDTSILPFTNYTLDFRGMIDYIFSTPQSLMRLGVLGPLDTSWLNTHKVIGFPHPHVSSDHIPLMSQYAVIPTTLQRNMIPIQHYGSSHSSGFGSIGR